MSVNEKIKGRIIDFEVGERLIEHKHVHKIIPLTLCNLVYEVYYHKRELEDLQ